MNFYVYAFLISVAELLVFPFALKFNGLIAFTILVGVALGSGWLLSYFFPDKTTK